MKDMRPRVLIFTSSFPHRKNPVYGIFIRDFALSLRSLCHVSVLAPRFDADEEGIEGVSMRSFPQCCPPGCRLAGKPGGILPALKRNPLLWLFLPFFLLSELITLARVVKRDKIEIIHAHWLLPQGFIAAVYKRFFNRSIKLVITCHGSDVNKVSGGLMNRLKRFAVRHADRVVAVSASLAEKVTLLCAGVRCEIQPMGINTEQFSPAADSPDIRSLYSLKSAPVLFVGSLIELKGVRELVAAWPSVKASCPDAELLIVGNGELKQELSIQADSLGVGASVHFAGSVDHDALPGYYSRSALFVLPSHSEGFSLVTYEALACGTATVVSRIPVFESLPEGERLFSFCEVGDSESIARAIVGKLTNPGDTSYGRQYVCERLSQRIVAERYSRFYSEVLNG